MKRMPFTSTRAPLLWDPPDPIGWRRVATAEDGAGWRIPGGLKVIASRSLDAGRRWIHISLSHSSGRLPTWPELVAVRDILAPDVECYQIAPPRHRYVNINPGVLHLWGCLDTPDGVLPNMAGRLVDGRWTI